MPAYLIADLKGTLNCVDPATRLCAFLTPQYETKKLAKIYGGGTLGDHARTDFERFNLQQVVAIASYLWWKLDTESYAPMIEQALENYWLEREAKLKAQAKNTGSR